MSRLAVALLLWAPIAVAAEPIGCDKFAWPLNVEQRLLNETGMPAIESGASVEMFPGHAIAIKLARLNAASLERSPERSPKSTESFAGLLRLEAPLGESGILQVTLSDEAWVDVIQAGAFIKLVAFTGARECPGVRKSVKFKLSEGPAILQLSDARSDVLRVVIGPPR